MKRQSLYFIAPRQVEIREELLPIPGAGQLLVETICTAVSAGTEMLVYRGQVGRETAVDETIAALRGNFDYPLKYGYAAVGRVIEVGEGVDEGWHGRLIFSFNPHESHFVANTDSVLPLPPGSEPEAAVFLPNMETAVSLLMDGRPVIGEQAAVFGQGIVGLLTTALLAQLPLAALVTLDRYSLRREWSSRLGGTGLDPSRPDALHEARRLLQDDRPYAGADLIYELSGNPQALDQAIELAGYHGRIVVGSWYGQKQATLNLGGRFHRSQMRLISSQVSHIAPQWSGRWTKPRRLGVAWEMIGRHHPERLISHRFPLAQAAEAYQLLDQNAAETLQVVLTYSSSNSSTG
jgi:2-desacetyl-2-hydroxyethyl bacteriochlorophyllide A dehydrogenase